MPAVSAIQSDVIAALGRELRYAGKSTLARHIERIEQLAPGIEREGVYPAEFLVYRVTGYRPDELGKGELDELLPGDAVLADLSALAELLSETAGLTTDDIGIEQEDHWTIDGLAKRWGVSRKTVERYRRKGLVARRVDLGSGHRVVVFMSTIVSWFEEQHADRLGSAAGFSRMSAPMRDQIIRDAHRYAQRLGWNRSKVCQRIAQRIGRSSESIRRVLVQHDDRAPKHERIFSMPGIANEDEQIAMLRQSLNGKRSGTIGAQVGRSSVSVNRAVNRARKGLILNAGFDQPLLDNEAALDESVLKEEIVCTGLNTSGPIDLAGLLAQLRDQRAAVVYEQTTRSRAVGVLVARCHNLSAQLHTSTPSGRILDEIETSMRWIMLLRIELAATQLSLTLSTIEERIGGPIDTLPPSRASEILSNAIEVVFGVVERFDGTGNRRLAAPVGLAMARWCSRLDDVAVPATEGKAGRRVVPGFGVADWTKVLWERWWWVMPSAVINGVPEGAPDEDRDLLTKRYGLAGERPMTLAELGEQLGTPAMHAGRMVQGALRRCEIKN